MGLKDLRREKQMTQKEVADLVGISLRSYKSYENDDKYKNTIKYNYICEKLLKYNIIDEENGILTIERIKQICNEVFVNYDVEFCILFGSYARKEANDKSDVDLLISTEVKGLMYYELVEKLRSSLHKKVDLLDIQQLEGNLELTRSILKEGIKIYG